MNQKQDFCILFSWSQEAESGGEGDDVTGTDPSYNTDLLQKSKPEEQEDEGQRMQKTHCSNSHMLHVRVAVTKPLLLRIQVNSPCMMSRCVVGYDQEHA